MEKRPASRASHGWNPRQRSAAPYSPMENLWEQGTVSWCWLDPSRGWSRDLGLGCASRLRGRPGATIHTRFQWALRHQPQPDVCRLDLALSWRCSYHAERVDGSITPSCGRIHPSGCSARRACLGGCFRGKIHPVPEAGSPISLTAGAERRDLSVLCQDCVISPGLPRTRVTSVCRHSMKLAAAVRLPTALQFGVAAFANGRHLTKGDLEEIRASRRWKTSWDETILGEHGVCGTAKLSYSH